ncbi:NACHT domain-containing protein [Streptomyces sp. NPDC020192]|uniref:NACHT domain-containing protein n=1 Tax=Streptomyces sp. NPDC020192 TaxID=3365066 RepID=UPI0037AF9577
MKFDLSRLGPREFENLTQSLALAEIGSALNIFGAGPDGGREATFEGPVTLGESGPTIEGYGVLQAKYCENTSSPRSDATWLIRQIRDEFKEWKTSIKRTRKPNCIIFATNVTLSGVPRTGGLDRVHKELEKQCETLGIREWHVWHGETINRLLENHPEIRTSYSAWVLPGDILAELYSNMSARKQEVGKGLQRYLAKELLRDLHVNLDQAGSADDLQIPLAEVFIDLPMGIPGASNANAPGKVLRNLINACDLKASPNSPNRKKVTLDRYVLVGGPGQGKSTVSQFLCQLYRANLIAGAPVARASNVAQAIDLITNQAARENLIPNSHRWPVKVPLTQLADELAHGASKSLLQFIAARASDASDVHITPQDLREWLATFPWLLLLDGLDEVPASSNRDQVLAVVNEFLMDVEELSADVVLIATTRPQGYTEEFSPSNFTHWELKPLGKERALHYAQKLATARHGADSERTVRLMSRLKQAADESSTARLMSSPLQVTIMAVLLDRMGKAPKDRYTLFKDYYRVIYERELEKEGAATNLLRDYRADVDAIHADVGLLLQTRSERSGDTESRIALEEFSGIIGQRLEAEGHTGSSLESLTKAISLAATDRLVFLVPSRAGEVGFEIRSLQEFWAADALMSASDEEVRDRLSLISPSSHWRNVFLFAVGKIFAERRHLRDSVSSVVAELNLHIKAPHAPTRRLALGSRLAVEILADGMVKAPKHEAVLVDQATKLFGLPSFDAVERLVPSLSESGLQAAKASVDSWILEGKRVTESLLLFLARLISKGHPWAKDHLDALYRRMDEVARDQLLWLAFEMSAPELLSVAGDRMLDVPIRELPEILTARYRRPYSRPMQLVNGPAWVQRLLTTSEQGPQLDPNLSPVLSVGSSSLTCEIPKLGEHDLWQGIDLSGVSDNHWLRVVKSFVDAPSPVSLKEAVIAVEAAKCELYRGTSFLPWPVVAALHDLVSGEVSRESLGDPAYLGSLDSWRAIESFWQEPISINDLAPSFSVAVRDSLPYYPLAAASARSFDSPTDRAPSSLASIYLSELLTLLKSSPKYVQAGIAQMAVSGLRIHDKAPLEAEEVEAMKGLTVMALEAAGHVDLTWLARARRLGEGAAAWLNRAVATGSANVWMPHVPRDIWRDWVSDPTKNELGRALCAADVTSAPKSVQGAISREWKRISADSSVDISRRGAICLLVSSFEPCSGEEDLTRRVEVLVQAAQMGIFDPAFVAMRVALSHDPLQQRLILGVLDALPGIEHDIWELAMDRLVADETSLPTRIDFNVMRAQ